MGVIRSRLFRVCPTSGRIVRIRAPKEVPRILFPLVGSLALIWFLIRVVPKPSRAGYQCQKVAAPLAGSFLAWLAGVAAARFACRQVRVRIRQARYVTAGLAAVAAAAGMGWGVLSQGHPAQAVAVSEPHAVNSPLGTARGLMPGRVVWVRDVKVTDWNGAAASVDESWFNHVNQFEASTMMQRVLTGYADTTTTGAAWNAIFENFNGGPAYQPGEKFFIKVNLVTSKDSCADEAYHWGLPPRSGCEGVTWASVGSSPQLLYALLDQLVNVVGVAQSDITIGDPTGLWVNELYDRLQPTFPDVCYLDARGELGRTRTTKSTVPLYWSAPVGETAGFNQDYLLQAVVDAKYVINFSVLKAHERSGITVAAKNHFGSISPGNDDPRRPTTATYYNLHLRLPLANAADAWPRRASRAQYRPLVDLNGHEGMGGKTLLYLIDGIYGGRGWAGSPSRWAMTPFNGNWPASLFLSMDGVAIDSVAFDFLSQQWPELVLANEGVQDYLHELALADTPPSGTFYDPENDGTPMSSQGVHEHWNNAAEKKYSRNLGTGAGIELVYLTPAPLPTVQFSLPASVGAESITPATVNVVLSAASSQTVAVTYAAADGSARSGSDYTAASGTLTFNPGVTSQSITVAITDDAAVEPDESFTVRLTAPVNASLGAIRQHTYSIVNDDSHGSIQLVAAADPVAEAGSTATITARRTGGSSGVVGVSYATVNGTATASRDYSPVSGKLCWAEGDTADKTFAVPIADDTLDEPDETFIVRLSAPTGGATLALPSTGTVKIADDDATPTVRFRQQESLWAESTPTAVVNVDLSAASGRAVTVQYATGRGTALPGLDYTARAGVLHFPPGSTSRTISVPIANDATKERDKSFPVTLTNPVNADLGALEHTCTIQDEDTHGAITLNAAAYSVGEHGPEVTITAMRVGGSTGTVSVGYATADGTATGGSDYTPVAGRLTWAGGDRAGKAFRVLILNDVLGEPHETFAVQLGSPSGFAVLGSPSMGTVTIIDNDQPRKVQLSPASFLGEERRSPARIEVPAASATR